MCSTYLKTSLFWETVLFYLLTCLYFLIFPIIMCFVLRTEGSFPPKVHRDIFSNQNPHSHHLHQVQVNPGGTQVMLPSLFLAVASPCAASLPPSTVSVWQLPLNLRKLPGSISLFQLATEALSLAVC